MSEINKISSNQPFDVRINQPSPDPKPRRESVNDEGKSSGNPQSSSSSSSDIPKPQTRQSTAMDEMMETLRKQQTEDKLNAYSERNQQLYRERNRQASEDYIKNQARTREKQTEQVLDERKDNQDNHKQFHSRIQDISRSHIQKMLKHKLEESTFKDIKRIDAGDDDNEPKKQQARETDAKTGANKKASQMDSSRLRPELSSLLNQRQAKAEANPQAAETAKASQSLDSEAKAAQDPKAAKTVPAEQVPTDARNLLDSAIGKLKQRLGGAHQGATSTQTSEFKPLSSSQQASLQAAQSQKSGPAPTPIRADLTQIQNDLQRSKALKESADGSRYVPLEDNDIRKLMTQNKLPTDYKGLQSIKLASQVLQDSSYHFQRAAVLLTQVGVEVTPQNADIVTDALRVFEQFQRPSVMNKLFRYLTNLKFTQLFSRLSADERQQQTGNSMDLGNALYNEGAKIGNVDRKALEATRSQNINKGLNLPSDVNPQVLQDAIKKQLQDLGLPANKVLLKQLVQSSEYQPMRAQALILQLAAGQSLKPEAVEALLQKLKTLPEALRQQATPVQLMQALDLPVSKKILMRQSSAEGAQLRFLESMGIPNRRLEQVPQSREALLLLRAIGERTGTLQALIPQLAEAIHSRPDYWMAQLSKQIPRLQILLDQFPKPIVGSPKQQTGFANALMLALDLPPERLRGWERMRRLGTAFFVEDKSSSAIDKSVRSNPATAKAADSTQVNNAQQTTPGQSTAKTTDGSLVKAQTAAPDLTTAKAADGSLVKTQTATPAQSSQGALTPAPLSNKAQAAQTAATILQQFQLPELNGKTGALTKESLIILYQLAERTQTLNDVLPRINQSLSQQGAPILPRLEQFLPALQQLQASNQPTAQHLEQLVNRLTIPSQTSPTASTTTNTPASAASQSGLSVEPGTHTNTAVLAQRSGPFLLAEHPLAQTMQRFYPEMPASQIETLVKGLQGAAPSQMDGFFQVHRLLGMLDPAKAQPMAHVWTQPGTLERLSKLSHILKPVLNSLALSPEKQYLSPPRLQNQLVQAMQNWLQNGKPEALQNALQQWLQPQDFRNPIGRVKEQLSTFGLNQLSAQTLTEVWQMSHGSRDRIDAMGILLQGQVPLFNSNIQKVLNYIELLPPSLRQSGAADILMHLSPELTHLLAQQTGSGQLLSQLLSIMQGKLPLIPENLRADLPLGQGSALLSQLHLPDLLQQLQTVMPQMTGTAAQDIKGLIGLLSQLQTQLTKLGQNPQAQLPELLRIMEALLNLRPQGKGQMPMLQAWTQILQSGLPQAPQQVKVVQDQLSGLLMHIRQLLPALQARTEQSQLITPQTAQPELLGQTADDTLAQIQQHLKNWGLQINSPEMLAQIQQLMQGSQDRLDAVAVLLKGNCALLPAHIGIIADYVKRLPPQERFRSISQILLFLSDELIQHMKFELRDRQRSQQQQIFPGLSEPEADEAEKMLKQSRQPVSEYSRQGAQILSAQPQLQSFNSLQGMQQLLTQRFHPQAWLGQLQQLLSQILSLSPHQQLPPVLEDILETLIELQDKMSTGQQKLSSWMAGSGAQMSRLSEQLKQQVESQGLKIAMTQSVAARTTESSWIETLLAALLGICEQLAEAEPEKAEQARRFQQQLQEQMHQFRAGLDAVEGYHQAEAFQQQQQGLAPIPTQIIPAILQQFNFPMEMLVQRDQEPDPVTGEKHTDILLTVQTHSLGQICIDLKFLGSNLKVRLGVERHEIQGWLRPYAASLKQKMSALPWEVTTIDTYVMPAERSQAPVLAQQMYRKYGRSAIGSL